MYEVVFGKYAVQCANGSILIVDEEADAIELSMREDASRDIEPRVEAYLKARGLEGQGATAKANIIRDFLYFEASVA